MTDLMTPAERIGDLIKNEKESEVIPFLQKLDKKEKKEVAKALKEFEYVWEFNFKEERSGGSVFRTSSTPKGTEAQKKIFTILSFVCNNQRDYNKAWGARRQMTKALMDQILPWYCPTWLEKDINDISDGSWAQTPLNYDELVDLEEKGYVTLTPELIVIRILESIRTQANDHKWRYVPGGLWKRPVTLDKHIWYLFDYESSIHWSDQYISYVDEVKEHTWKETFKLLIETDRLNRKRVLSSSLQAANKNFNTSASGWFIDLFFYLEPTDEEMLEHQHDILALFTSPHSKVINGALKAIKKIVTQKDFARQDFVDNAPVLLTSETKSVVKSALMVLDKIARKDKDLKETICIHACQAFLQQDNDIQLRAAKLIAKYADETEALKGEISMYQSTLMTEPKGHVAFLIEEADEEPLPEEAFETAQLPALEDMGPLGVARDFDELMFLSSQAFDNNEAHHFDALIASLIHLQDEVKGSNIAKLEPALQRAYKSVMGDWNSRVGYLDNMLATFFIEYGKMLVQEQGKDAKVLHDMATAYYNQDVEMDREHGWYRRRLTPLKTWHTSGSTPVYFVFREMLVYSLEKLSRGDSTSLLSTPTHLPCFIDPQVLVDRVKQYQEKKIPINELDLQIALARCFPYKEVSKEYINSSLNAEMQRLFIFYLTEDERLSGPFERQKAWITAAISKDPEAVYEELESLIGSQHDRQKLTGAFEWYTGLEPFMNQRYDYKKRKSISFKDHHKKLVVKRNANENAISGVVGFIKKKFLSKKVDSSLYAQMEIKEQWLEGLSNDIARFLSLTPNNPGPLLVSLMEKGLKWSTFSSESDKKSVISALEYLAGIWNEYSKVPHDFLAITMTCSDKTARTIAGEIWVNETFNQRISHAQVGAALAKTYTQEFSPVKRFADLAINLYTVSPQHKEGMFILLHNCLRNMPEEPARNLKKLLMLLKETTSDSAKLKEDELLQSKFGQWKQTASLKKVIESL
ncbi:hypothetical protein JMN32_10645 [Fulvivirga sp. 29W222]|uniref:Uncharacterized protein n=1 Tax=Fulvivirga marina TaxID=2494733 RepID=A0A937FXW0_9BACT|nr:DUF6493 family protein [Fulvivirga marina]MBL6446772.1 hypothetical protein [Fulvivirga marina]